MNGSFNSYLLVVDKVEPRHNVDEDAGVSALSARNTLHVFAQLTLSIQRLARLDFRYHLAHVHLDFASILGEAVESVCKPTCQLVFSFPLFFNC